MQMNGVVDANVASRNGIAQRRVLPRTAWIMAGVGVVGLAALAVGANWIAFATLVPLLYVLPCAAMMFMCMKGMNHGPNSGNGDVGGAGISAPPSSTET